MVTRDRARERIHAEDVARMDETTRRALEERAPFDARFRVHMSGPGEAFHVRWLRTTGRVFFDARGQPKRFDGITLDITAEHQLEESLRQTLQEKNESLQTLERVNTTGQALAAELHLEKLVQGVTDAATQLCSGPRSFGAFFYNVLNEQGQRLMLYTLSGAPWEAFSKFPVPCATRVLELTFQGKGILRSGDILATDTILRTTACRRVTCRRAATSTCR